MEKINFIDMLLRQPLDIGGPLKRRYYATINLKDFRNIGPPTQGKYSIRYTIQGSEPFIKVLFL